MGILLMNWEFLRCLESFENFRKVGEFKKSIEEGDLNMLSTAIREIDLILKDSQANIISKMLALRFIRDIMLLGLDSVVTAVEKLVPYLLSICSFQLHSTCPDKGETYFHTHPEYMRLTNSHDKDQVDAMGITFLTLSLESIWHWSKWIPTDREGLPSVYALAYESLIDRGVTFPAIFHYYRQADAANYKDFYDKSILSGFFDQDSNTTEPKKNQRANQALECRLKQELYEAHQKISELTIENNLLKRVNRLQEKKVGTERQDEQLQKETAERELLLIRENNTLKANITVMQRREEQLHAQAKSNQNRQLFELQFRYVNLQKKYVSLAQEVQVYKRSHYQNAESTVSIAIPKESSTMPKSCTQTGMLLQEQQLTPLRQISVSGSCRQKVSASSSRRTRSGKLKCYVDMKRDQTEIFARFCKASFKKKALLLRENGVEIGVITDILSPSQFNFLLYFYNTTNLPIDFLQIEGVKDDDSGLAYFIDRKLILNVMARTQQTIEVTVENLRHPSLLEPVEVNLRFGSKGRIKSLQLHLPYTIPKFFDFNPPTMLSSTGRKYFKHHFAFKISRTVIQNQDELKIFFQNITELPDGKLHVDALHRETGAIFQLAFKFDVGYLAIDTKTEQQFTPFETDLCQDLMAFIEMAFGK